MRHTVWTHVGSLDWSYPDKVHNDEFFFSLQYTPNTKPIKFVHHHLSIQLRNSKNENKNAHADGKSDKFTGIVCPRVFM